MRNRNWAISVISSFWILIQEQIIRKNPRFFNLKPSNIGLIGRLAYLLLLPLIFVWLMSDPLVELKIEPNTNEPQEISAREVNEAFAQDILTGLFQTTLELNWYQLCLENLGAVEINGRSTFPKNSAQGEINVNFWQGPTSGAPQRTGSLSSKPDKPANCTRITKMSDGLLIGTTTISLGTAEEVVASESIVGQGTFSLHYEKMYLYIRPDWIVFLIKYLVLLIALGGLTILGESLVRWVVKKGL